MVPVVIIVAAVVIAISDTGLRVPWLPLETRPDSPGEPGMQPRDPCLPWYRATYRKML